VNLTYEAINAEGKQIRDVLAASSVDDGVEQLRRQGMFVTHITPQDEESAARSAHSSASLHNISLSTKQLVLFTRQMAMLLKSGSALAPALASIAKQMKRIEHRRMVEQIREELEEGNTLADAVKRFPRTFDPSYCAVIAAGESSATLPEMFARLADIVGKRRSMQNRIVGAMIYPTLLVFLSIKILGVMMFFVVPRFAGMFGSLGVDLPASTKIMLSSSALLRAHWYIPIGVLAAVVSGIVFLVRRASGQQLMADIQIRIPLIGRLMSRLIQAKTFRVLGMLLEARVGLLEALSLASRVTRNRAFQKLYGDLDDAVSRGESIASTLEISHQIDPSIVQAVRTGEQSGRLGESISYVADVLDEDNTELLNTLTRLVEPMILIVMGLIVGIVAVSLFMPLFDMTAAV